MPNVVESFTLLILFIIILIAAYFVTKLVGHQQYLRFRGSNIQIIESISIAPQKMLQLIKAGEKYYLIALTKDNIALISEIDKDYIKYDEKRMNSEQMVPFKRFLKKYKDKYK